MPLEIGTKAPSFTLPATGDQTISLSDFKGKPVIVYFYPKDDTPGCTQESCDFRDNVSTLDSKGVTVLGISKDSVAKHEKFKEKYQLNFPLLSDEKGDVVEAYGAWVEKSMYGKKYMGIERMTYLIDANGTIAQIWPKVKIAGHVDEVCQAAETLIKTKAA